MHILYVVQYFNRPDEPGGSRAYQFAQQWGRQGHRVTVLTGNLNYKTFSDLPAGPGQWENGVRTIRVRTYNRIRGSFRRRLLNFASFAIQASRIGSRIEDYDLVYASSTPLTTGIPGWWLSRLRRKPFVFEVRDLWPESAVVAGVLRKGLPLRAAETLEQFIYRHADLVVGLTQGICDGVVNKGKAKDQVLFVPNGMDDWMIDYVPQRPADFPFPPDSFVCTYIGAHGKWNKVETILEAAARLSNKRIRFLLIGDGDYKQQLREYAARLKLTNLVFLDAVPKKRILDYLSQSQLALICTWDHPFQKMVLPNKVFDYMASGCPIAAAARGEVPDLLRRAGCGWSVDPEQPDALARLIREASEMPADLLTAAGRNGREFARRHFLRPRLADSLEESFRRLVEAEKGVVHGFHRAGHSTLTRRDHAESGISLESRR